MRTATEAPTSVKTSLNLDNAEVFHQARLLVPTEYRLPRYRRGRSSAHASTSIGRRCSRNSTQAEVVADKLRLGGGVLGEREAEIARFVDPNSVRFNRIVRRVWWYGCVVDATLVAYGYCPRQPREPPHLLVCYPAPLCAAHTMVSG
jgi:hypothetical protein